MSDLFEEDEASVEEVNEDFSSTEPVVDVEAEIATLAHPPLPDARRRLENMLDEKRLRNELDDFVDY